MLDAHTGELSFSLAHNEGHDGKCRPEQKRVEEERDEKTVQDDGLFAKGTSHFAAV